MLKIAQDLISQMEQEAQKAYPHECCGFIFGKLSEKQKTAEQILPSHNATSEHEKYHRFVISPEEMLKAERLAHFIKLDIIGFYHSHPDCAAEPSDYDTRHALPVYSYVIVSVRKGKVADCKSWELDPESCKQFQSEKLDLRKNRCANNFSEDESR